MRVLVVQGPNKGKTLDYSTRQAEAAIARGWAVRPPAAEETPAVPPGEVVPVVEVELPDGPDLGVREGGFIETASIDPVNETADAPEASRRLARKPRRGGER